jgi:hypothetical protein
VRAKLRLPAARPIRLDGGPVFEVYSRVRILPDRADAFPSGAPERLHAVGQAVVGERDAATRPLNFGPSA